MIYIIESSLKGVKCKIDCYRREVRGDNLIIVLHGNQQNNEMSKTEWSMIESPVDQVEYLQSHEIDSYQLFRWEEDGDGPIQLKNAIDSIDMHEYVLRTLAGFSASCNTILRAVFEGRVECDKIILQSPWMPSIQDKMDELIELLIEKDMEVLLICGLKDVDCLNQCVEFHKKAKGMGLKCKSILLEGLGHDYPEGFKDIVKAFL